MIMYKRIPTHEEQPYKLADAASSFPSWNCEALVRKIQQIDGFSRREAEMQIDAMAQEFRESSRPRTYFALADFYRTGTAAP